MAVAIELVDGGKYVIGKLTIRDVTNLAEARRQIISLLERQCVGGYAADGPWDIRNVHGYIGAENESLYMFIDDNDILEAIERGSVEFVC